MKKDKLRKRIKSNQAFTMQDLVIAIMVLLLFVGTIGGTYLAIYQVQADTKLDSVATLYMIQMLEYIDKIGYDEVTNGMEKTLRTQFAVPSRFEIAIDVSSYLPSKDSMDLVKRVKLTMHYTFQKQERNIVIENLKVKEI